MLKGWKAFENLFEAMVEAVNVDTLRRDGNKYPGEFVTVLRFLEDILESNETDAPTNSQHDQQASLSVPEVILIPCNQRAARQSCVNYN